MTVRLLSALAGVLTDRFRTTTGDATGPATPLWSPHLNRIPGWSASTHHTPVISQRFPATPDQVKPARTFVADILGDDHPHHDDAILLTSELATNAIEHSTGPADSATKEFVVTVAFTPHGVIITVQDPGSTQIPCTRTPAPTPPAAEDSSSSTNSPPAGASTATPPRPSSGSNSPDNPVRPWGHVPA